MTMLAHEWGPSRLNHGEAQCVHCLCTNREAWVLGPICRTRSAQAIEAQRAGTTKIDPVHESAVVADDAPTMGKSDQEGA